MEFETVGKFRLIDSSHYGENFTCYIQKNKWDSEFDDLKILQEKLEIVVRQKDKDFNQIKLHKKAIENQLKKMSGQIIQIRLKPDAMPPPYLDQYFDIYLVPLESYSSISGINLGVENQII